MRWTPGSAEPWKERTLLPSGATIESGTTNARGCVRFGALPPGAYMVRAETATGLWGVETVQFFATGQMLDFLASFDTP